MNARPFGIIFLAILAVLGAAMASIMSLQVLSYLLALQGYSFAILQDFVIALFFGLLVLAFCCIAYGFLTIDLTDWYSVISVSLLNFALIILSGISLGLSLIMIINGLPWSRFLSVIIVYGSILTYCVLLDNKKAFWSPGRESILKEPKPL
jgi:hypothetical protein